LPHPIKGEGICAYLIIKKGIDRTDELISNINKHVRKEMGPIITLDRVIFVDELPKTRSGKIMRRVLRKLALGDSDVGDLSTLADSSFSTSVMIEATKTKNNPNNA
jgi:acetyl-CoA synthetase